MSGILHLSFMLVIIRDEKRNENKDNLDVIGMVFNQRVSDGKEIVDNIMG